MEIVLNYEGLIPILGGLIGLLMATGRIDTGLEWVEKFGLLMKIVRIQTNVYQG
jgi:uncharacterized ion transporter superfamily protein YfcC